MVHCGKSELGTICDVFHPSSPAVVCSWFQKLSILYGSLFGHFIALLNFVKSDKVGLQLAMSFAERTKSHILFSR